MKKYHHCVKFTYPLSFQTRIPKVDQHTGGKWLIHLIMITKLTKCVLQIGGLIYGNFISSLFGFMKQLQFMFW